MYVDVDILYVFTILVSKNMPTEKLYSFPKTPFPRKSDSMRIFLCTLIIQTILN